MALLVSLGRRMTDAAVYEAYVHTLSAKRAGLEISIVEFKCGKERDGGRPASRMQSEEGRGKRGRDGGIYGRGSAFIGYPSANSCVVRTIRP